MERIHEVPEGTPSTIKNWYMLHLSNRVIGIWELPYLDPVDYAIVMHTQITGIWKDMQGRLHLDLYR